MLVMKGYCRFTYPTTVIIRLSLSLAIHSFFSTEREVSGIKHDPMTNCNQLRLKRILTENTSVITLLYVYKKTFTIIIYRNRELTSYTIMLLLHRIMARNASRHVVRQFSFFLKMRLNSIFFQFLHNGLSV